MKRRQIFCRHKTIIIITDTVKDGKDEAFIQCRCSKCNKLFADRGEENSRGNRIPKLSDPLDARIENVILGGIQGDERVETIIYRNGKRKEVREKLPFGMTEDDYKYNEDEDFIRRQRVFNLFHDLRHQALEKKSFKKSFVVFAPKEIFDLNLEWTREKHIPRFKKNGVITLVKETRYLLCVEGVEYFVFIRGTEKPIIQFDIEVSKPFSNIIKQLCNL